MLVVTKERIKSCTVTTLIILSMHDMKLHSYNCYYCIWLASHMYIVVDEWLATYLLFVKCLCPLLILLFKLLVILSLLLAGILTLFTPTTMYTYGMHCLKHSAYLHLVHVWNFNTLCEILICWWNFNTFVKCWHLCFNQS